MNPGDSPFDPEPGSLEAGWQDAVARLLGRARPPRPWRDGRQIPWNDPEFSERVLAVHLDPRTHMASRSPAVIRAHVDWLLELLSAEPPPGARPRHLLDLACGPGLYALALARAGLRVTGIDFSPAAVAHARSETAAAGLDGVEILEADLTALPAGLLASLAPIDIATFWFGELASLTPPELRGLLGALAPAVAPGGLLVLESQPWDLFPRDEGTSWEACERSVFLDHPHLWLQEWSWDEDARAEITVHWLIDGRTGEIQRHAQTHQAYTDEELAGLLAGAGFDEPRFFPPITGVDERFEFPLIVARRRP
jgi:SAM-dependent methyltransferase